MAICVAIYWNKILIKPVNEVMSVLRNSLLYLGGMQSQNDTLHILNQAHLTIH